MKFYLSQIIQLLDKIDNRQIKALLLYGPDKGYIDKVCKTLLKKFDLLKTSIEYSDVKSQALDTLVNTQNFFMQKQLILVRSVGESIDKSLKLALSKDSLHFLVFIADELSTASSIRKFFETETYLASLACYHDDEQKVTKIILHKCNIVGKVIRQDAMDYLISCLKGDHQTIVSKIDKLINFTFDKEQITLDNARQVVSDDFMGNGDNLCAYFSSRDTDNFLQEFNKLKQQNINEVLIIRALIRYYLNLYTVLSKLETGVAIDMAIKSLSPPIFYKYVPNFKKAVNKLKLDDCITTLKHLQQAEIDYKLNPAGFDIYQQIYVKANS
ncbi:MULTISPECIES: DNA polymerase III subunit delta [unclassified Candidatus Tisiphia]|uniref:DNA polymerase III subunit delta n=1 Tax=unclassified Candidatus Tisiphia TaxID=2996318 RepID=UPI00312C6FD4